MSDIKYLHMDITGWNKKAKDFLKRYLECASTYQMSFGPCSEEEIDHYIAIRGKQNKINRVIEIIAKRYKKYPGETSVEQEDSLVNPLNENGKTFKQFIDQLKYDSKFKELSDNLNTIARNG